MLIAVFHVTISGFVLVPTILNFEMKVIQRAFNISNYPALPILWWHIQSSQRQEVVERISSYAAANEYSDFLDGLYTICELYHITRMNHTPYYLVSSRVLTEVL